jgi:hypothetical protein
LVYIAALAPDERNIAKPVEEVSRFGGIFPHRSRQWTCLAKA